MELQGGNRFFFEFEEEEGFLSEEESNHLIKVLRKKRGDRIKLINGKGFEFEGCILEIVKQGKSFIAKVRICRILRKEELPPKKIFSLIPLLKGNKTEFLIEKGTELGINAFIPFYSEHSVVKPPKKLMERLKKKAISALKQSGRLFLPEIFPVIDLKTALLKDDFRDALRISASIKGNLDVKKLLNDIKKYKKIVIISGPEGGFSKVEEELLEKRGFIPIKVSPYVLRAETASLVLMGILSFLTS